MLRLGPHTKKQGSPEEQREIARDLNWSAIQTHFGNPRSLRIASAAPKAPWSKYDPEKDPVWAFHAAYTSSATPKAENEKATANYLGQLLVHAQREGAKYVVVHVGGTKDRTAEEVGDKIKSFLMHSKLPEILAKLNSGDRPVKLLVENTAALYPFNQNLRNLTKAIADFPHVGWCLDTAHSNAAGIVWSEVQEVIRESPPDLCHANFPGSPFGCGRDRHGWRTWPDILAGKEESQYSGMTPDTTRQWDETIRVLAASNVPLILEGGSYDGDMNAELEFVRSLLSTHT